MKTKNLLQEQLSLSEARPINARVFDYKHFFFPWHMHNEYEIIYIEQGEGTRFIADSISPFFPGDILLVGSNLPHFMKSAPEYECRNNDLRTKGIIIQFEKNFMAHAVSNYPVLKGVKSLLQKSERGLYFPKDSSQALLRHIKKLPKLSGIKQLTHLLTLLGKMSEIESAHTIGSDHYNNAVSYSSDIRIDKVLSYIRYNYTAAIKLELLSSMVSMNTTAFCRYFKEKVGKTFVEYMLELRIGYACKLLINNKGNISQISMECGFNTISHFNQTFKRIAGLSPRDYRKHFGGQ
ncbi:AraC family transcriptional regulator [Bacteroidales bacterium]|nr:AraC family transcriptional regulator [Bacteroidales bacterium]